MAILLVVQRYSKTLGNHCFAGILFLLSPNMRVCGFTFIRNAIKFDYPIREAIQSIMPLCDEIIVVVGNSDDGTRALIEEISYKIKIVDSVWDDTLREGGEILAQQTDLAKQHAPNNADWLFYIQGDECIHEKDIATIREAMKDNLNKPEVEGLLFKYYHFYGSFDYIGVSRKWYRKEIRIIRNDGLIRSWRDAQGFRKNGQKLKVKEIDAWVYHYGWVKNPLQQQAKQKVFHSYWHDDKWLHRNIAESDAFDYSKIDLL